MNRAGRMMYFILEDYFIAEKIVSFYTESSKETFSEKYSWITRRADLLEFFGIVLAEKEGTELNEIYSTDDPWEATSIRDAFLYGLTWRKGTSFTPKTWDYINHEIFSYEVRPCFKNDKAMCYFNKIAIAAM